MATRRENGGMLEMEADRERESLVLINDVPVNSSLYVFVFIALRIHKLNVTFYFSRSAITSAL